MRDGMDQPCQGLLTTTDYVWSHQFSKQHQMQPTQARYFFFQNTCV